MAQEKVTAVNSETPEVTESAPAPSGEPVVTEEAPKQNDTDLKLATLEAKFADLERERNEYKSRAEQEAVKARTEADRAYREEQVRKGIQHSTTAKLQRLAELESRSANNELTTQKLNRMERLVEELARTQLDEETRSKLDNSIEAERLRLEVEQLKAAVKQPAQPVEPQQPTQPQSSDAIPVDEKKRLLEYYFDSQIDPSDSRIDWALTAGSREEWFRRVGASVRTVEREAQQTALNESVKKSSEEALASFREEQKTREAELRSELTKLREEREQADRKNEEQLKRDKGIDREDNARPDGNTSQKPKSVLAQLMDIPDEWAKGTKEQKAEFAKRMSALRQQALKGDSWRP